MAPETSDPAQPRPSFFIVGAPKCGSGSLWRYLAGHPDVFMPKVKEPNYFGSDVRSPMTIDRLDVYLGLFAGAGDATAIGEASTRYLRSRDAAAEIAAFQPRARIIVLVREPVAQVRSMHNHFLSHGIEDIADLGLAIDAGVERFRGTGAGKPINAEALDYRRVPLYAEQLASYRAVFPADRIHVIVQEEFARETAAGFRDVLRFLGVDDTYQPEFERHNVARRTRAPGLARWLCAPPARLRRLGKRVPPLVRQRIWDDLVRRPLFFATSVKEAPALLDPAVESRLRAEFAPDVHRLAAMIDRPDLPALWGY